jgi:hypothetical protein
VAVGPRRRAVVEDDLGVVLALLGLELQPVADRGAADEDVGVLLLVEEDAVADDVAGGRARHELLGHVHREVGDAVDRRLLDQLDGPRAAHEEVDHVVGLVVEDGGLPPGPLLTAPVRELRRDHRVDVRAELGVAKQLHGVARLVQDLLEVLCAH